MVEFRRSKVEAQECIECGFIWGDPPGLRRPCLECGAIGRRLVKVVGSVSAAASILVSPPEASPHETLVSGPHDADVRDPANRPEAAPSLTTGRRITRPPGGTILKISDLLFTNRFHTDVVEPTVGDLRIECQEALAAGQFRKAKWLNFWGHISLLLAFGNTLGGRVLGAVARSVVAGFRGSK